MGEQTNSQELLTMKPVIEVIPATKTLYQTPDMVRAKKLRVAAYARVSTDQDEQFNSYEAQVDYYTKFIQKNPEWEFAGIFADLGITGTNMKNRDEFNKMIGLALSGEIDLILTKSISRFARNTVDTLQTVRELKKAGVEVQFEKEHLHTFDPKCEMMLTIMSSLAQEESRSISENVRWGKRKSMEDGNFSLAYSRFLGYRKGADGRPEIVEEEARIIRKIFDLYLKGLSICNIAKVLTEEGIPTPTGKKNWPVSTVNHILQNEKYKGEALLQKTFTVDYLTKEVRKNKGELPLIRVKNSHEPIISPEIFDKVQEMMKKGPSHKKRTYSKHPFAGKLICGDCGSVFGHKVWRVRSTGERYDVWYCNHKFDGERKCKTQRLREDEVKEAFTRILKEKGESDTAYSDERWLEIVDRVMVQKSGWLNFQLRSGGVIQFKL